MKPTTLLALGAIWLSITLAIFLAFLYAPPAKNFIGESSRILFFHVPMAWVSSLAFIVAGVASVRYLRTRDVRFDHQARSAVGLGLIFGVLATVTGSLWARVMWNSYWNWDPRQSSIILALTFYLAYFGFRSAVEEVEARRRLAAAYAALGLIVAPFLFYIAPRIAGFTLHPEPILNANLKIDVESRMRQVLLLSSLGFTAFFVWLHVLNCRLLTLLEERDAKGVS